ncbi:MAG: hypothetical protein FWH47_04785 [Methanomassiliicoccaceae archaeon]|nr:hypothetical protein [Methanomassiliicoccaceae archaeon]
MDALQADALVTVTYRRWEGRMAVRGRKGAAKELSGYMDALGISQSLLFGSGEE